MPELPQWLHFEDPLVRRLVYGALVFVALVVLVRILSRWREARTWRRRREQLRKTVSHVELQKKEVERLARHIIATSSTSTIAGFELVKQVEAVFSEGHRSPADAAEVVKAIAASKGANAVINLTSHRPPTGRCFASGDAVIVRPEPDATDVTSEAAREPSRSIEVRVEDPPPPKSKPKRAPSSKALPPPGEPRD